MRYLLTAAVVALFFSPLPSAAQVEATDTIAAGLRVFLDCGRCDEDYLRTEIDFVDYVRERQTADVHVLITTQQTGGGGTEYSMRFVGQRAFAGVDEELLYASNPTDSEDQERRGMARVLQAGFVRYASRTPLVQRIELSFEGSAGDESADRPTRDPWNSWVFQARIGADLERESLQKETEVEASLSASRTTEAWKIDFDMSTEYSQDDRFVRDEWIENVQRDHEVESLVVRSISNHWSVGGTSSANHSTFENRDLALRVAPAIEYNVFPYFESTRRSLTIQYSIGANRISYLEETLFGHMDESLVDEQLEASLYVRQPWGSLDAELQGSHYFHDLSKYRLEANGGLEVNLFRGLSLDLRGSAQRIHDQLHIPGGDRTPEEILLEQRELATAYRYGASVGISYSFGSIFNSVVNPRMSQGGGGGFN
ncbi:MAG: hypothetical protein WD737_13685 [Gemmatimonadota bacterium]